MQLYLTLSLEDGIRIENWNINPSWQILTQKGLTYSAWLRREQRLFLFKIMIQWGKNNGTQGLYLFSMLLLKLCYWCKLKLTTKKRCQQDSFKHSWSKVCLIVRFSCPQIWIHELLKVEYLICSHGHRASDV